MKRPNHDEQARQWEAEVTGRVARNVQEYRRESGLSAQRLSDETATLGYPIARNTIANLEAGRKATVTVQEVLVLAEALGVPFAALLYSPLHPGEAVRPTPHRDARAHQEMDRLHEIRTFESGYISSRVLQAWNAVRQLSRAQSTLEWLRNGLAEATDTLDRAKLGRVDVSRWDVGGWDGLGTPSLIDPSPSDLDGLRRMIEVYQAQIQEQETKVHELHEHLDDLGIDPWDDADVSPSEAQPPHGADADDA